MTKITRIATAVMLTTFAGVAMAGSAQAAKVKRVCEHKVGKRIYGTCASHDQRPLRIRQTYPTLRQNFRARTNDEYAKDLNGGGDGGGRGGRGTK